MKEELLQKLQALSEEDLGTLLEIARVALSDGEIRDYVEKASDLSGDEVNRLEIIINDIVG